MKVVIIGSGGREHALTWKLRQDKQVSDIFCLPGNAGTSEIAQNVTVKAGYTQSILDFCKNTNPDLVVIGPEDPLAAGLANILRENSLTVFGPGKEGTQLESSKAFAKEFMGKYSVPTGKARSFTDYNGAWSYISTLSFPLVIKADGLAAGKGVFICHNIEEAKDAIDQCFISKLFGLAGEKVLVEEFLEGQEVSLLCFTDGSSYIPMVPAQDHKAVFDNDAGPNTGGMGCYSPVPIFTKCLHKDSMERIIEPVINALKNEKIDFRGVLYCGLILTEEGPKVLEFNTRFGDPETQVILPRMKSSLMDVLMATSVRELSGMEVEWLADSCITVVAASSGYPGDYETGFPIEGIEEVQSEHGVSVFHAGTALEDGKIITAGGRVLSVTALATDFETAREKAYKALGKIHFEGKYNRSDIGLRAIQQRNEKEEEHCLK